MRLQPAIRGIAITRRDHRWHRQPHAAMFEAQQLRVAVANRGLLAFHQVAEVEGQHAVGSALQHDRGVALVDRVFVFRLGVALFDHDRMEQLLAQPDFHVQQHRRERQRKRIDSLDVCLRRVAVALFHRQLEQQSIDLAVRRDAQQRHGATVYRFEHCGFVAHIQSFFLMFS